MMQVIIAGGRDFTDLGYMRRALDTLFDKYPDHQIKIISGTARGADQTGEAYAKQQEFQVIAMPADWKKHGKSAGYRRNAEMAAIATHVVCFWDGKSRGTKHMIDLARSMKLPLVIYDY